MIDENANRADFTAEQLETLRLEARRMAEANEPLVQIVAQLMRMTFGVLGLAPRRCVVIPEPKGDPRLN